MNVVYCSATAFEVANSYHISNVSKFAENMLCSKLPQNHFYLVLRVRELKSRDTDKCPLEQESFSMGVVVVVQQPVDIFAGFVENN